MTDLRDRVRQVIAAEIAPSLGLTGGDIEVLAVADGIATVRLGTACAGCGGVATVVAILEQELRQRLPEVEVIEAVA
jgi:Fe-S cluster biogenesis protein NfuA